MDKNNRFYCLESVNMINASRMTGYARTTTNFKKFFLNLENAKKFAQEDYKKESGKEWKKEFKWEKEEYFLPYKNQKLIRLSSGDLGFVEYTIINVQMED